MLATHWGAFVSCVWYGLQVDRGELLLLMRPDSQNSSLSSAPLDQSHDYSPSDQYRYSRF